MQIKPKLDAELDGLVVTKDNAVFVWSAHGTHKHVEM